MKLIVDKGELNLPEDFSFEIEKNSAFFSDEGSSSIAATIPATPADLDKLGHPTRIARQTRYANLFPAVISNGVFQKKGTLVVNSASEDGITCAMALEDSEFYSQWKETNLKELFAAKILTDYPTPQDWYSHFFQVYTQAVTSPRFRLIPVAVSDVNGNVYLNNEPVTPAFVTGDSTIYPLNYEARIVQEGDDKVSVPVGYGIAPFYLLYAFLEDMFDLCGYQVRNNCFRTNADLSSLLLLHNCSDVLCNGRIDCSDLVPNKSISELLQWLLHKFHAQIVVYPATAMVDIVLFEDILQASFDKDLTGKLIGKMAYSFSQPSRVVITPNTSLRYSAPAADTMEELVKKYGHCHAATETEIMGFGSAKPDMGLVLRLATGSFYEYAASFMSYNPRSFNNVARQKGVGSNCFKYDRQNSKDSESLEWDDLTPAMVFAGSRYLAPFIGERKHRNTQYNESTKDEDQEIIIADYAGLSSPLVRTSGTQSGTRVTYTVDGHYYYGTTQKYDNVGNLREGRYNLNAPEMFTKFFRLYNKMLRNNMIRLEGRFDLPIEEVLSYQMYALKLYQGQMLLPVSFSYEVGKKIRCLNAAFYQVKDYSDGEEDSPTVIPEPEYTWVLNESQVNALKASYQAQDSQHTLYAEYDDEYSSGEETFFLAAPISATDKSPVIERKINIYYTYWDARHQNSYKSTVASGLIVNVWFEAEAI